MVIFYYYDFMNSYVFNRSNIKKPSIILPLKNPPLWTVRRVMRRIGSLPIPPEDKIIIDESDPAISEKIQTMALENNLIYLYITGSKHKAIDIGIKELRSRSKTDAVIIIDDDSLIDDRWVEIAKKLLERYDMVWGFGFCRERDYIAGFVNIDLNVMVAMFDQEYWLHSGVFAFRLDAFLDVGGFGKLGLKTLSEDHALLVRFTHKNRTIDINPALQHRVLYNQGFRDWFKQKIRWMGELLLISRSNVFLLLISIPLIIISPLLMWKASRITQISFPKKSIYSAPVAFMIYSIALLLAYNRIIRGKGFRWKGRNYNFNLQK